MTHEEIEAIYQDILSKNPMYAFKNNPLDVLTYFINHQNEYQDTSAIVEAQKQAKIAELKDKKEKIELELAELQPEE